MTKLMGQGKGTSHQGSSTTVLHGTNEMSSDTRTLNQYNTDWINVSQLNG